MALRNLTTASMVSISMAWVNPAEKRPLLEQYKLATALLPHLEQVHENLLRRHRAISVTQGRLADLQQRLAELDAQHDRKIRGISAILEGFAEISDDPSRAGAYLDLRDKLLPDGLRAVSRSYRDQGGEIILLRGRLDAGTIQALREIPTPQGSLYDEVEAWMRLGTQIGDLDAERMVLAGTRSPEDISQADVARARNEWIRVVRALRTSLAFDNAEPEVVERIFRILDRAEAKADRRRASKTEPLPSPEAPPPCSNHEQPVPEGPDSAV